MSIFHRELSEERVRSIAAEARALAEKDDRERAWKAAQPLVKAQRAQHRAAEQLAALLEEGVFERAHGLEVAGALLDAHEDDLTIVATIGDALESVHDLNFPNAAPPDHPTFETWMLRHPERLARCEPFVVAIA